MAVPSSISSSDIYATTRRTAPGRWVWPLVVGALALAAFIGWMEALLAARGFHPSAVDTNLTWAEQRERASTLGAQALIIVGASRAQADLDLATLRRRTGLEPVQLAIDGASITPVLEGLAQDPRVVGTVLIDVQMNDIASAAARGQSAIFEETWEQTRHRLLPSSVSIEAALQSMWRRNLRSYADGAKPVFSLESRVLTRFPLPQYAQTYASRERALDYHRVPMPHAYLTRVAIDLKEESGVDVLLGPPVSPNELEAQIAHEIERLPAADAQAFNPHAQAIADFVGAIRKRGGKVLLVEMPTSGLEHALMTKRYPHEQFFDRLVKLTGVPALRSDDVPQLRIFPCPDGSHLDYRDRVPFTNALADALWPGS